MKKNLLISLASLLFISKMALSFQIKCAGGLVFKPDSYSLIEKKGEKSVILFASNEACGIGLNFKSSCITTQVENGEAFEYSFRCDEIFGDVLFTREDASLEFRCFGPGIHSKYASRLYEECSVVSE